MRRGKRGRAGALSEVVRRPQGQAHAFGEFVLAQQHKVVEIALHQVERQVEGDAGGHAFGKCVGRRADDTLRPPPGTGDGIGVAGADTDDARLWCERIARRDQAARAAAAANGHEDDVDTGERDEDLKCVRAHAGEEQGLIGGMHVARAGVDRPPFAALARLVEIAAALLHHGAERAHRRVLLGIVAGRHEHRAGGVILAARHADRLAVVARARGDDAASAFIGGQRGDEIQPAAHLERAGRIVILVLDPQLHPGLGLEQWMAHERRRRNQGGNSRARRMDVFERGHRGTITHRSAGNARQGAVKPAPLWCTLLRLSPLRVLSVALLMVAVVSSPAGAQSEHLVVLTTTGVTRDGLPVLAPAPNAAFTRAVIERGFSGRLVRLYAFEQTLLQRRTGAAPEPAYLVLSDRQGGFPQFGFYLGDTKKPDAGWIDLHRSSTLSGRFGAMDQIFPHELMHVIMRQLAGAPRTSGGNQMHAIGVRTDPVADTARLPVDTRLRADADRAMNAFVRDLSRRWWPVQPSRMRFLLWFSQTEQVLRYHAVKANAFARMPAIPDRLLAEKDKYAAYLFSNVVPGSANGAAKPATVMLSSEGVVSHLFWRVLTDPALQQRRATDEFYSQFGAASADVTPLDNVFLKLFAALADGRPSTAAELLRAYVHRFPDDAGDVDRITRDTLLGAPLPAAGMPELWLANDALTTGTSLFDQYRALPRPHTFDANAASVLDWLSVPDVTREQAETLVAAGPYATLDDVIAAAPASRRSQISAMSGAMTRLLARAVDEEETLNLRAILMSYVWRLAALIVVASLAGAWLARKAGARRVWTSALIALAATLLVFAFAWVITCPAWYPFAAPVVIGGLPWALWRAARRRSMTLVAQPFLIWLLAAAPALIIALV